MQVGPAYGAGRQANYRVRRLLYLRLGHVFKAYISYRVKDNCFHKAISFHLLLMNT
jgi:hypothetical protein